jgi:hypothetical protein
VLPTRIRERPGERKPPTISRRSRGVFAFICQIYSQGWDNRRPTRSKTSPIFFCSNTAIAPVQLGTKHIVCYYHIVYAIITTLKFDGVKQYCMPISSNVCVPGDVLGCLIAQCPQVLSHASERRIDAKLLFSLEPLENPPDVEKRAGPGCAVAGGRQVN